MSVRASGKSRTGPQRAFDSLVYGVGVRAPGKAARRLHALDQGAIIEVG